MPCLWLRQARVEAARKAGRRPGRPPKVTDEEILAYLRRYPRLSLRAIWKIMRADGREISYDRLTKRVKSLEARGAIARGWQAK